MPRIDIAFRDGRNHRARRHESLPDSNDRRRLGQTRNPDTVIRCQGHVSYDELDLAQFVDDLEPDVSGIVQRQQ